MKFHSGAVEQPAEGAPVGLLTTKEAARMLGVSVAFLQRDRWQGARIPYLQIGRRAIRYDPAAIAEYLKTCVRISTTQEPRRQQGHATDPAFRH